MYQCKMIARLNSVTSVALLLCCLASPGGSLAQVPGSLAAKPYFSLSTNEAVRPGEAVPVSIQTNNVTKLQFRLYKVNDPLRFFAQLPDAHRFGGSMRRSVVATTPLEKFRVWKSGWRARFRNVFRAQFSAESRAGIRQALAKKEPPAAPAMPPPAAVADFASIPVLNPQQLVRTWEQVILKRQPWESATVKVPLEKTGVYVLEATDGTLQAYTLLSATSVAIVTKSHAGKILIRVVDREKGAPIHNAMVTVLDRASQRNLARERTGADGLLEIAVPQEATEGVLVVANNHEDYAVSALDSWSVSTPAAERLMGYVYTDRPVYRPGHTVHFRAILRTLEDTNYALPGQSKVPVEIRDAEGNFVLRSVLKLSRFGTVHGELNLAATAPLGYYGIQVGERGAYGGFTVEEYRKPEYEVRVTPETRQLIQGAPARYTIQARYYYGEPVFPAKVTYVVWKARYWSPYWGDFEQDEEFDDDGGDVSWGGEQVSEATGQLNSDGQLTVTVPTTRGEQDVTYRVEARVADAADREITASGTVVALRSSMLVKFRPVDYFATEGKDARFALETMTAEGKPVLSVPYRVSFAAYDGRSPKDKREVARAEGATDSQGKATVLFRPKEGGSYIATVTLRAPEGREIREEAWLWVSGQGRWWGSDSEQVKIIPDKASYKAGDTARLLILTGSPCNLWFAVEGKKLYDSRFIAVSGQTATVEVPITAEQEPEIFAQATFIRNNTLHSGAKRLKIPPLDKEIKVALKTDREQYRPGENARLTLDARDMGGNAVEGEFSVGVVDEAIYAIQREFQPDILKVFYGPSWNRVHTESSLNYYFSGEAGTRQMILARIRNPNARAQLKPERIAEPRIRKLFPDTIYWIADLTTNAAGRAETSFAFPDSLTTWRTTARGVTSDTRAGSAVIRTVVRKNLVLTMGTPRFLTEGDNVTVPVIVRNYLPDEKRVQVSLGLTGGTITGGATQEVTIATRGEARIDYQLTVPKPGQAVFLAKALAEGESDALEITVPVQPKGDLRTLSQSGVVTAGSPAEVTITTPALANPNERNLEIRITPSVAGALFAALEYLTSYPYGCTEQTMSSFLPNLTVVRAMEQLGAGAGIDRAELNRKVKAGLERLYGLQHEDGAWGWWRGDDYDAFMTAYVVNGLQEASDAGYRIRGDVLERGRNALKQRFPKDAPDLMAFVAYALRDKNAFEAAWTRNQALSAHGLAIAGLAAQRLKDSRAGEIASRLEAAATKEGAEVYWKADQDTLLRFRFDNSPEATAWAIKFLARQRPESPLLDAAAQWLVAHRRQGYYWESTKQTAMVIDGLVDYLKRSGELKPDLSVTVSIDGKPALTRKFTGADALKPDPVTVRVPAESSRRVQVSATGTGRVYWSSNLSYYSLVSEPEPNPVLSIQREYYRPGGGPVSGPVRTGDRIEVRLKVSGPEQRYLLIEDPIPAGAEGVRVQDRWYMRKDLRDNRAAFLEYYLEKASELRYTIVFTNAGKFTVGAAKIEAMYQPGLRATTSSTEFEVLPR